MKTTFEIYEEVPDDALPQPGLAEMREAYEPEETSGHDLPWRPTEDLDDFDTWAERVLSAGGYGVAALDFD